MDDYDIDEIADAHEIWADPAIRDNYLLALGGFIMAHNEVDFWMSALLTKAVQKLAPDQSLNHYAMGDFATRATNLMLLMKIAPQLPLGNVGDGQLLELNRMRNILAHGHFDQDPYEGSYKIVRHKHRALKTQQFEDIRPEVINDYARKLVDIARHMEAVNAFFDVPIPTDEQLRQMEAASALKC